MYQSFDVSIPLCRAVRPLVLTALAALCLSACADINEPAPPATVAAQIPPSPPEDRSGYGLFLAGQTALDEGDDRDAAELFVRASHTDDDILIRQKAFLAAVVSGEIDQAAALAPPPGEGNAALQKLSELVRAVDALAEGRGKDADAVLAKDTTSFNYVDGIQLLKPWAAMAAGDGARASALPETQGLRLARLAATLSQALICERLRRYDEADADYRGLIANAQLGDFYVLPYGAFLERRGRLKDAAVLYKKYQARAPADRGLKRAMARLADHKPAPPMPSIKEGASAVLVSAAEIALVQKAISEGDVYLRLALRLDPQRDDAWLLLGDVRSSVGEYAEARQAYAKIAPTADAQLEARERVIASYQGEGDHDTALALARELVKATPGDRDTQLILADALRESDRNEEAIAVLSSIMAADPAAADWTLYFQRGAALSQAGHWPEAEKDLLKALSLQPDAPDVLNYLGYSWVEKDERLPQAMAMIQKAAASEPQSGEVADSLGWAYYHLGDYKLAVLALERAISLNAVSPEITDHLGDAYWRVGRKVEAQFQWRRVLGLKPSPDLKASVEKKLASGLDAIAAPPASVAER
jgi:Flp pilus assembly protein TadD